MTFDLNSLTNEELLSQLRGIEDCQDREQYETLLIERNKGLALSLIRQILSPEYLKNRDNYENASSIAINSLLSAIRTYNPDKGYKFSTYATISIRNALIDLIRVENGLTRTESDKIKRINSIKDSLTLKLGRTPTIEEIYSGLDRTISKDDIESYLSLQYKRVPISLDNAGDDERKLEDTISDPDLDPAELAVLEDDKRIAVELINSLTSQEKFIYYARNPEDGEPLSFEKIGSKLNITAEWARQLYNKIEKKIKDALLNH